MNWLHYILQVNVYLVLFYGFFRIALQNETFHQYNRAYLVCSAVLSFGIPFWYSDFVQSWFVTQQVNEAIYSVMLNPAWVISVTPQSTFTWMDLLKIIYVIGIVLFAIRLIIVVSQLVLVLKRKEINKYEAFSFFGYSFVADTLQKRDTILAHEHVHVQQLHSFDVLLFEVIAIANWFNPVVYFYKRNIKHIHEFIADEIASTKENSKADYAILLFSREFGLLNPHQLTNSFYNRSTLKRRIFMLQKEKSRQVALLKYGLILPLFISMLVFSSAWIAKSEGLEAVENIVLKEVPVDESILQDKVGNDTVEKITVLGSVVSYNYKVPLPNVAVTLKGSNLGTITDFEGKFIFSNIDSDSELEFHLKGFRTEIVSLNKNKKELSIVMMEDTDKGSAIRDLTMVGKLTDSEGNPLVNNRVNLANGSRRVGFVVTDKKGEFSFENISLSDRLVIQNPSEEKMVVIPITNDSEKYFFFGKTIKATFKIDWENVITNDDLGNEEEIFTSVDELPEFEGGVTELYKFIGRNIQYPALAQRNNIHGKVFLRFVVKKDGSIGDVQVLKGIGFGCDAEAARVIKSMPKWKPGKQNGKPVNVYFTMPISFIIEGDFPVPPTNQLKEVVVVGYGYKMPFSSEIQNPILDPKKAINSAITNVDGRAVKDYVIVIDGVVTSDTDKLVLGNVKTMNVIDGEESAKIYGLPNKKGVILVSTVSSKSGEYYPYKALYLIEDEETTKEEVDAINPDKIRVINVYKSEEAIKKFGEKGKHGVVQVLLKK